MKITIDNKNYQLDISKAKKLGLLKEERDFKSGDVFQTKGGYTKIMILAIFWAGSNSKRRYQIFGCGNSLIPFSNFDRLQTKEEILKFLEDGAYKFVKNAIAQSKILF